MSQVDHYLLSDPIPIKCIGSFTFFRQIRSWYWRNLPYPQKRKKNHYLVHNFFSFFSPLFSTLSFLISLLLSPFPHSLTSFLPISFQFLLNEFSFENLLKLLFHCPMTLLKNALNHRPYQLQPYNYQEKFWILKVAF